MTTQEATCLDPFPNVPRFTFTLSGQEVTALWFHGGGVTRSYVVLILKGLVVAHVMDEEA